MARKRNAVPLSAQALNDKQQPASTRSIGFYKTDQKKNQTIPPRNNGVIR
jgi:hypothetical protein